MVSRRVLAVATLVAGSTAQFAQFSSGGYGLSVNIPSDTAASSSGPIYLQISAPSGTQWIGFGQGSRMSGANMLIVYAADSSNVTVSPRLGTGHVEPKVNSDAQVSVLEGTGIASDGSLVANIRCDTCLSWNGGSMSVSDTSSSWIYAYKKGDALDSTSTDASISQHDVNTGFNLDLTSGTGGSSSNPFVAASSDDSSSSAAPSGSAATTQPAASSGQTQATATASNTATETGTNTGTSTGTGTSASSSTATATVGVSNPLASSNPSTSGSSHSVSSPNDNIRTAHGVIMGLVFVVLFPMAALTIYVPYREKVRHVHAPLQAISLVLMIVGLGLGVQLGKDLDELDAYHQVIGYIVVAWMVLFQPALGLFQHLHFRRTGARSPMGHAHRWVGRAFIALGVVNGGLGLKQAGPIGNEDAPTWSVVLYSVISAVCFIFYLVIVSYSSWTAKKSIPNGLPGEKPRPRTETYELHGR
ncbi:hypothetical protein A1O3_01435 [Capronia epimyces CBS 606.96]|uniref:DOMON domain-containing protein n=1 Tax=Capronia epimyces CBS 606.96 TaxID=1182542 RepID=W9YUG7_9EURO|nr:uncharacterized protein A1O3_01435 [Capronia epimyces CBS 606.96]EXJ92881.1 hypothetical protein A1O3_01435 [Capronia epimyces CBS 606.96]